MLGCSWQGRQVEELLDQTRPEVGAEVSQSLARSCSLLVAF